MVRFGVPKNVVAQNLLKHVSVPKNVFWKIFDYSGVRHPFVELVMNLIFNIIKDKELLKQTQCRLYPDNVDKYVKQNGATVLIFEVFVVNVGVNIEMKCTFVETSSYINVDVLCGCGEAISEKDAKNLECGSCTETHFDCSHCQYRSRGDIFSMYECTLFNYSRKTGERLCEKCYREETDSEDYNEYSDDDFYYTYPDVNMY